jgi:ABC-type dipeptide/oligopeptide/nickel transport system permease subunit
MALDLNLPVSVGIVLAIIAAGTAGLVAAPFMTLQTTLMMVLPSMLVFAAIVFLIGVKHGEYRASAP